MYDLEALGADACRSDRSASCTYWHLKCRALAGEPLTDDELRFVGFAEECPDRGGWHDASSSLEIIYHDRDELSSEDSAMLSALMSIEDVTQGMAGFLG